MNSRRWCVLVLVVLYGSWVAAAQELTVAAAADLQFAFQQVSARFAKQSGKTPKMIFGSSGNFYAQIQNGGPFDVFFSADIDYPRRLEAAGLAEPGTLYPYATGKIVLWIPQDSRLDLSQGLRVLLNPAIHKIAIANPEHAPYGRAAVAALKREGLYDSLSAKLVLGENISQAASFVASGSADIGIIALSLALAPSLKQKGRYVEIPPEDYPPIEQGAVILRSSKNKDLARQFMAFLKTRGIQELLQANGFSVSTASPAR